MLTVANNRYFIGNFDGISFTAIDDRVTTKPNQTNHKYQRSRQFPLFFFHHQGRSLDYGRDNYAAVTYSDLGGRIVSQVHFF